MSEAATPAAAAPNYTISGKPVPAAGGAPPAKVSDAEYEAMRPGDRRVYAERFSQGHEADGPPPGYRRDADRPQDPPQREQVFDGQVVHVEGTDGPKIKIGDAEFPESVVRAAIEEKAARDVAAASRPTAPENYALTLPADLKLPEGVEFKFAIDDPVLGEPIKRAQEFAHRAGLSEPQFQELLGIYASSRADEIRQLNDARAEQVRKLGAAGTARVTALNTYFDAHGLAPLKGMMVTADIVDSLEKLVHRATNTGGGFSQQHRDGGESEHISDAEWNAMSFTERRAYSERASATNGKGR